MKCPTCGAEIQPGQQFCPSCGAKQPADQAWGNPYAPAAAAENRDISKSESCRSCAPDKMRRNIGGSAVLYYISAAITAVFAILFNPTMLLDTIIVLVLGLLIHLKQSRVCAVLLLAYSLINLVVMLLSIWEKLSGQRPAGGIRQCFREARHDHSPNGIKMTSYEIRRHRRISFCGLDLD